MGFFSSKLRRRLRRSATASLFTLGLAGATLANPSGATVRHGQVNISPGVHAQIQQLTDQAIVDWQSFSIGPNESVHILQPGALSVLLNRVTGVDPSTILGSLEANGNVWLINPNGILFGPGSTVNVGGLVASTLDISNQDFLSGNYNFLQAGPDLGAVVNQGQIRITDGGYAVLTGPSVMNEGTIIAKSGTVVLAAGEQATLNFDGRDLVSFAIGQSAGNGTVLLAPGMMSDTLAETFGVSSALRADQLVRDADGSVRLVNSSGTLVQAGEVSVDGQAGQDAGTIVLHSADVTVLTDGSTTSASGQGTDSNGGDIYVLSYMDASASDRGFTDVGAGSSLLATGGTSGDGGFIEVSGDRLNLHGEIDLSATDGRAGDFLLDPVVVTIVNGSQMPTDTTDPIQLTTTTTIGDDWLESLNLTNLTIESAGDIIFDIDPSDGILDFRPAGRVRNLTLTAGTGELGDIFLGDDGTSILGLTNLTLNTVDAGGGDINLGNATVVLSGALDVNSSGNINLQTSVLNLSSNNSRGNAPLSISAAGDLNMGDADIDLFNNFSGSEDLLIEAGGNLDWGTADLTYNVASQLDPVTTTIRAGGNITSSGDNVINVAGATLIEGDAVSLTNADITVKNTANNNSQLTVNAGLGALDLSDSNLIVSGPTTLSSATTMNLNSASLTGNNGSLRADILIDSEANLNMIDTRITGGGSLTIDGEADVNFGPSTVLNLTINEAKGSTPLTISAAGNLDLANADIDVFNNFSGSEDLLIEAGGNLDWGTADLTYNVASQLDPVTTTIRAGGNITSSGGNVINVAGATLIEGDAVSLANADITVKNTANNNSQLTVNAGLGALDLSDSNLIVSGPTTLSSATTMNLNSASLTGNNGSLRADILIDSEANLNMVDTRITGGGSLTIDGEADVNFGPSTVLNLTFNEAKGSTPLTISAAGNLDLANADIDVFNNFAGSEDLLIEAGGNLDWGTADLTYNVATQLDPVTTTIRAGGNITSSGGNVINVAGATLIEGDAVSLANADITVKNTANNNSQLTVNAGLGALDLSDSNLIVSGPTTLSSATTMNLNSASLTGNNGSLRADILIDSEANLNMVDTRITGGGSLTIDGEADVNFGPSTVLNLTFNEAKGSTPLTISAAGNLDLANADIDVFNNFAGSEDLLIVAGGNLDWGTADLTYNVATQLDPVTTTIRAGGNITSSGGNVIDVAGATLIEGDSISLADAAITVDNAGNANSRLTVNSTVGALDLNGGTFNITGATTLTSATTMDLSSTSLTGNNGSLRADVLIDSEGDLNMADTRIITGGRLEIDGEADVTFGPSTVLNLGLNASKGSTPLTISAAGNLDLANADIDVFNNFAGSEELLVEAGGNLDWGTADLTYNVATSLDPVTTTIRAGGNITSSGGNVIDVAGATLIEGDSISLADAAITVDNAGNANSRLTVNSTVGALDLSGGTFNITGATTLTSATTMDLSSLTLTSTTGSIQADILIDSEANLNMVDTRITGGGSLTIDGEADVTLGPSTVIDLGFNAAKGSAPLTISAVGNLDLANADIDVFNNFAGSENLLIEAGGNLDWGTADLTYNVATQLDPVTTTIRAGGNITSSGGNVINVAGATLIEGDAVSLANADITVKNTANNNSQLTVNAGLGALDLSDSNLIVSGPTTLSSATTMNLNSASLTGNNGSLRADILIDSEANLNMVDTRITGGGSLTIDGEADVNFGPSTVLNLTFNEAKGSTPLTISAAGNLDLANADIDVFNNFSGNEDLLIEAGGLLDLGTADLTYSVASQIDVVTTTIRGGGGITSESNPNPAANSFNNVFNIVGATAFETGTGDLQLFDTRLNVTQSGATSSTLNLTSEQGGIVLGESSLSTQSNIVFLADTLDAGSAQVATPNRVTLAVSSGVDAEDSQFDAGDIEIFGSTMGVLDPSKAVAGDVRLDLSQSGNTDISVLAEGDVEINHTGTGSITLERAGLEGPPTGPASKSVASLTGDVFITSAGTVFIGSAGDTSPDELVNGAGTVRIDANTITDRHTGGIDVVAGETLELITDNSLATSANPLEVQAPGLLLDLSRTANNQGFVNVAGDVEFLQVIGRSSNIRVTELASGANLTALRDGTGTSSLNLDSTTFENIDYVDFNTIRLDTLNVGPTQSISVKSVNGDIVDDSAGDNAILEGGLLLTAENGSIGSATNPISVNGGVLAVEAGNDIFVQGSGDDLRIGQVDVVNTTVNAPVASGAGMVAGGDIQIAMPGAAQTLLTQQADITSAGGIAIVLDNGDFQQTGGTVRADNVALQIGRNAGQFDGTDVLGEISIEADNIVVDVTEDAILSQTTGDLTIADQLTIGGATYSTTGAGGDLRVRVTDGDLNIDTDLTVGEQAALLTGDNDVVGQGNLPNSINLNGSINAGQSLVLISQGDINHLSGTLTAPSIGLGANGLIGSAANPIQLSTGNLAVNPFEAQVNAPNGFTTVSSVSAVGATVNQGVPQPPEPPTPEPPTPEPEVPIPPGQIPPSAFQEPQDFIFEEDLVQSEFFSQNQTALVEELLDMLMDPDYTEVEEVDPTRIPVIDDEDFLQKKFRR